MLRPFRPTLERLEKREVFSAGPLSYLNPATNIAMVDYLIILSVQSQRHATGIPQGTVSFVQGETATYDAVVADLGTGSRTAAGPHVLPAVQQDDQAGGPHGIPNDGDDLNAAVQTGGPHVLPAVQKGDAPPAVDASDYVVWRKNLGAAGASGQGYVDDLIGWDFQSNAAAHDAVFEEVGVLLMDGSVRNLSSITDGTSNTLMFRRGIAVDPSDPSVIF